ncbi:MAG TPA: arginine decarboxylase, pyruvoyl-dependent [Desulfotomaculum sp.]|jgi:arginine decarboxylase|nr:arginine decarboxylase, pyruvoyl-dependent [Desulfotomaculum sp.]
MLPTPRKYFLTAASAEGNSHLTAFDNALLAGGIGNINLIRVSSILPPGAKYDAGLAIPAGSLVPVAYGHIISETPGELIAAAVGIAIGANSLGVIMEFAGHCPEQEARDKIKEMLDEAFGSRGIEMVDSKIASVEHRVEKIACALAAVPMWY